MSRLIHVVCTKSMRRTNRERFCATYLQFDFGVPKLLRALHERLRIEDVLLIQDELKSDYNEKHSQLKTALITGPTVSLVIFLTGMITWIVPPVGAAWTIACGIGFAVATTGTSVAGGVLNRDLEQAMDSLEEFKEAVRASGDDARAEMDALEL